MLVRLLAWHPVLDALSFSCVVSGLCSNPIWLHKIHWKDGCTFWCVVGPQEGGVVVCSWALCFLLYIHLSVLICEEVFWFMDTAVTLGILTVDWGQHTEISKLGAWGNMMIRPHATCIKTWFSMVYFVDPTWRSKTAFGWICKSTAHWDIHIPWVLQCGEVCDPSAAMGQCFVAFLCSLRCLVDGGANSCKPIGGEIHWLRFMLQICGKYESARANQQHWPIISPVFPTTLVEAMWDVWLYDDVSSALKQWYA